MDNSNLTNNPSVASNAPTNETNNLSATPASPAPASAPKKCNHAPIIVLLAILAVLGLAAGAVGLVMGMSKDRELSEKNATIAKIEAALDSTATEIITTPEVVVSNTAYEYDDLIETMHNILDEYSPAIYYEGGFTPFVVPEGLHTAVPLRFYENWHIMPTETVESTLNAVNAALEKAGFAKDDSVRGPLYDNSITPYLNKAQNIACLTGSDTYNNGVNVSCGNINWTFLTTADYDMVASLENAFYEIENHYPTTINIHQQVKNSTIEPYQTITVSLGNAAGLFYRVSPDAEWQFFTGTQSVLSCSDFNTEDLRNAYSGMICWDETTNSESTVNP